MSHPKRDYLGNLDVLRFLAALWVVATHYGHIGPAWGVVGYNVPEGVFFPILKYGYLGVPIFFCLSGFLIAHVSANTDSVRFAANRVMRLMPGFWVAMTLTAIGTAILGTPHGISLAQWAANLTLLPQFFGFEFVDGVYWTLVYEFIFYGWVALLLFAGIFHSRMMIICAMWLVISALNHYVFQIGALERLFITEFAGAFVSGLMLWHAREYGWSVFGTALIAASVFLLAGGLVEADKQDFLVYVVPQIDFAMGLSFAALVILIVGAGIFMPQIQRGRKTLIMLGGISYPLYLVHQELGYAIFRQLDGVVPALPMVLVTTAGAIILAWLVHTFGETPLRKLLQKMLTPMVDRIAEQVLTLRDRFGRGHMPVAAE